MKNKELKEDDSQVELSPQSELNNSQQGPKKDYTEYILSEKSGGALIYLCKFCDYKSKWKQGTVRHVRSVHLKEKDFECAKCRRKYSDKRHLATHVATCTVWNVVDSDNSE